MFDIGAGELAVIIIFAVIILGPEKIPDLARKLARIVHWLRHVANDTTKSIKSELGPEYKDLTVRDLNPKVFAQKYLLHEIQAEIDTMKSNFNEVKGVIEQSTAEANSLNDDLKRTMESATKQMQEVQQKVESAKTVAALVESGRPPFDDEAT